MGTEATPATPVAPTAPVAPVEAGKQVPPTPPVEKLTPTDLIGSVILSKIPGLNARMMDFIQKNPEIADIILANYEHTAAEIQTEADLGKLSIELKIYLLIASWVGGDFLDKNLEKVPTIVTIPEVMRGRMKDFKFAEFKAFHDKANTSGLTWAGDTRALWTDRKFFDTPSTMALLKTLKLDELGVIDKWPDFFPYVPGTRMVLPKDSGEIDAILTVWGSALLQCGVKLTKGEPGGAAPNSDEIQIFGMKDTEPMDWKVAQENLKVWKDTAVPTQFSSCPQMCAAFLRLEDQEAKVTRDPKKICEAVGYANPPVIFLEWLGKGPNTNP